MIEETYKLIAYVGRGKDDPRPHWLAEEGFRTFQSIFRERPAWSQFAVLQTTDGRYLCVDLYETEMSMETMRLILPPHLSFTDLDAAIMAAQLKL